MIREKLGFTLRAVEAASTGIAKKHKHEEYQIPVSRLSDFENKGVVPSIYRLYSLAVIFRLGFCELLSWYGISLDVAAELNRHKSPQLPSYSRRRLLTRESIGLRDVVGPKKTTSLISLIEQWGTAPLAYLERFSTRKFIYGYIGCEDFRMYPLLQPGTFVQVDGSRRKIQNSGWRSQYDRPIYFVETKDEYFCCWCSLLPNQIVLESHPLSPEPHRIFDTADAEVLGQVIGAAFRVGSLATNLAFRSKAASLPAPE